MKSFYEFLQTLSEWKGVGSDWDYPPAGHPDDGGYESNSVHLNHVQLGEDDGSPYHLEVNIRDGKWECISDFFAKGYVPNGSENPLSRPEYGAKWPHGGDEGTTFENPGRKLEFLPASLMKMALQWVEEEVSKIVTRNAGEKRDG